MKMKSVTVIPIFFFVAKWISQNEIEYFYTQLFAFIGVSITNESDVLKNLFSFLIDLVILSR